MISKGLKEGVMKKIYNLRIEEKDDYYRSNNTIVCQILNIDEQDKQKIERITIIDGIEKQRYEEIKVKVNGEYRNINSYFSGDYFDNLEEVKEYIKKEYKLVMSTKHSFYFLSVDDCYNSVVVITNYKDSHFGCSDDYVNLQTLLELEYKE